MWQQVSCWAPRRSLYTFKKFLSQVSFPLVLDVYEFCTDELKKELEGPREAAREAADRAAGLEKAAKVRPEDALIFKRLVSRTIESLSQYCCHPNVPSDTILKLSQ